MCRVLNGSRCLKVSKLGAETAYSGSWFHIRIVLGKKEYRCAFTVDCGKQNLMLCPLDALAGMRDGVAGIATRLCTIR